MKRILVGLALAIEVMPVAGMAQPVTAVPAALDAIALDDLCEQAPPILLASEAGAAMGRAVLRTAFCVPGRADAYDALQAVKRLEAAGLAVPRGWALSLAVRSGNSTEAWPRLEALLADPVPVGDDVVEQSIGPAIALFNRNGMGARLDERLAAAVQGGLLTRLAKDDDRAAIAERAINYLVQHDPAFAESLLDEITQPRAYLSMLALRSHAPIWPALERRAGPGMAAIMNRHLARIEARMQQEPDNELLSLVYVTTLRSFGHYDRAISVAFERTGWPNRPTAIAENDAWLLNEAAHALDQVGRVAEGDAIMNFVAQINPRRSPWVVNFAVNRSARLANLGRSADVMAVLSHDLRIARDFGSPYARLILTQVKACSLAGLGRTAEATAMIEEIRNSEQASYPIAADAYLCLGEQADARRALSLAMRGPDFQSYYAREFQGRAFDMPMVSGHLPDARELVRSDPSLMAQFEVFARFLPPELALR